MVALERLEDLVENVEDVVHGEDDRARRRVHDAVEDPVAALGRDEAGERLRLDEGRNDHLCELLLGFGDPGVVDVVFERVKVVLDHADEALVVGPLERAARPVVGAGSNALEDVMLGDADEREELVDIGQPEDARVDRVVVLEALQKKRESVSERSPAS